jgi:hypothetical protein
MPLCVLCAVCTGVSRSKEEQQAHVAHATHPQSTSPLANGGPSQLSLAKKSQIETLKLGLS